MLGGDRGLQRVRPRTDAQGLLDQRERLVDLRSAPARAILILEEDDVARLVEACLAPGVVEEHQRE